MRYLKIYRNFRNQNEKLPVRHKQLQYVCNCLSKASEARFRQKCAQMTKQIEDESKHKAKAKVKLPMFEANPSLGAKIC